MQNRVIIDDAAAIRELAADQNIGRRFVCRPVQNWLFLRRLLGNLSYKGAPFPHMLPKDDAARTTRHTVLWEAFNAKAAAMAGGAPELKPLAQWVGNKSNEEPGVLVQQIIGQFFKTDFKATPESWQAALILQEGRTSKNILKVSWWRLTDKVGRAKKLLGSLVNDDIVAMHGIAVASHNLVASIKQLRAFYTAGNFMAPEMAVEHTLSAPPAVYRQALADGAAAGCPYSKFTLFLLKLKDANRDGKAKDMVFMSGTWSRCRQSNGFLQSLQVFGNRLQKPDTAKSFISCKSGCALPCQPVLSSPYNACSAR